MAVGIADCFIKQRQSLDLTKSMEGLFYIGLKRNRKKSRVKWQQISVYIGVTACSPDSPDHAQQHQVL